MPNTKGPTAIAISSINEVSDNIKVSSVNENSANISDNSLDHNSAINAGIDILSAPTNSYPRANDCPRLYSVTPVICQSIDYVDWKIQEYWGKSAAEFGIYGNAKDWGHTASTAGLRVDDSPKIHSVGYQASGTYGHVVWIEGVNSNGTINVSEYNNLYSSVSGKQGDFGYRFNVSASIFHYIHFD